MIKITTTTLVAAIALVAVAGTASATTDPVPFLYNGISGVSPAGSPNITTTGGSFKYKVGSKGVGKLSYKAKTKSSKGFTSTLNGAPGLASSVDLANSRIKVKKGTLTIQGVDPISGNYGVLVSATYDESAISASNFILDYAGTDDVFGMTINITDCPMWDFCTTTESIYITGEFGSDVDRVKVKGSKNGGATAVTTIPVPAAVWLFGTGLLGLVGVARRRKAS